MKPGQGDIEVPQNLKHFIEAPVSPVAAVIMKESLSEVVALVFAQATDHLPRQEDHHLYGAGANVNPCGFSPPHQARNGNSIPY